MEGLDARVDELTGRMRLGNWEAILLHAFNVELNGFVYEARNFSATLADSHATGKVWHVRAEARRTLLDDNEILHTQPYFLRPACLRTLLSVPGGTSTLGLPETVTVPALLG